MSLQYFCFFVIFCNKFTAAPLAKRGTNPSQLMHLRNTRGEPELIIARAQLFVMHMNHSNTVKSPLVDSPNKGHL